MYNLLDQNVHIKSYMYIYMYIESVTDSAINVINIIIFWCFLDA